MNMSNEISDTPHLYNHILLFQIFLKILFPYSSVPLVLDKISSGFAKICLSTIDNCLESY